MAIASTATVIFCCAKPDFRRIPSQSRSSSPYSSPLTTLTEPVTRIRSRSLIHDPISLSGLIGTGLAAAAFVATGPDATAMAAMDSLQLSEPANALSLPTWAVHVSSVVEWFLFFFFLFLLALLIEIPPRKHSHLIDCDTREYLVLWVLPIFDIFQGFCAQIQAS